MRSKKLLTPRQPQYIIVLVNAWLLLGNLMYHHDDLQSWQTRDNEDFHYGELTPRKGP